MPKNHNGVQSVLVVDDHSIVRKGLRMLLERLTDIKVCGEAENAKEALERIHAQVPDMVITDVALPGMNGIELTKHIAARWPNLPVLVISRHDESLYAERALLAGARGYVMKQVCDEALIGAVASVSEGGIYASKSIKERIMFRLMGLDETESPLQRLSDRELEVFDLIGRGYSTREVAETLDLSVKTIESYRARIKDKLNLKNSFELLQHAVKWGQQDS